MIQMTGKMIPSRNEATILMIGKKNHSIIQELSIEFENQWVQQKQTDGKKEHVRHSEHVLSFREQREYVTKIKENLSNRDSKNGGKRREEEDFQGESDKEDESLLLLKESMAYKPNENENYARNAQSK